MIEPKLYGRFLPVDEKGYIVNDRDASLIQPAWRPLLQDLIGHYIERQPFLHSVYIRGSVGDGRAVDGISDIDSLAVIDLPPDHIDSVAPMCKCAWLADVQGPLKERYPFCDGIETYILPLKKVMADRKSAFFLQSQSVCIYGTDLTKQIAPYKVDDMEAYAHAPNIGYDINYILGKVNGEGDPSFVASCCKKVMKRILRATMEMCMADTMSYTRDLYLCHQVASQFYPESAERLDTALHYALNPTKDAETLKGAIHYCADWLVDISAAKFPRGERKVSFIDDFGLGDPLSPVSPNRSALRPPAYSCFPLSTKVWRPAPTL